MNTETTTATLAERFSVDDFMDLFIASLVLRGRRSIGIRGTYADVEQPCMHRLYRFVRLCCARSKRADREWLRFVVKLRNELAPSPIGSFDGLRALFARKQLTYIGMTSPFFERYTLEMQPVTARCLLRTHSSERLRRFAERAAKVYVNLHE